MSGDFSSSGHTVTCQSAPQLVADEWVFDGSSSFLQIPDHSDFTFSGDFTIELFGVKFHDLTVANSLFAHYQVTSPHTNDRSLLCAWDGSVSPKKMVFLGSTNGTSNTTISVTFTPTADTAYNMTWERSGTTLRMYTGLVGSDLTMIGSGTMSGALYNSAADVTVGCHDPAAVSSPFNGRLKAIRVTNGTARYATDTTYTPPSLPLPTS